MMNAVVLTVKASYVASTKYRKLETKVLLQLLHGKNGFAAIIYFQRALLPTYIIMPYVASTRNCRRRFYIRGCMNNNPWNLTTIPNPYLTHHL